MDFNDDQKVAKDRKGQLGDFTPEGQQAIEAPIKDQISTALRNVLADQQVGEKTVEQWDKGIALRSGYLEKQRKLLMELDEFIEPIYRPPKEWQSNLHIPMAYVVCKAFHARMYAALMGQDPPFQVRAQKEANTDRAPMIQDLMRHTVRDWANYGEGIENVMDEWLWAWCTQGRGIIKTRWTKDYTRFVDIQEEFIEGVGREMGPGEFVPTVTTRGRPVKVDELIFEGPLVEHVNDEDILIVGGNGNPDRADLVIEQVYMTADQLWALADRKIFDGDVVAKVIEAGNDPMSAEAANMIKQDRAQYSKEGGSVDDQYVIDRYQILEAYVKIDIDGSGIGQDVVLHVHKGTREILRAVYLYNVAKSGRKPYSVIEFHKRKGQDTAVGLVELIYPLSKEMDAMHNMKVDFGILSTLPIGFYRATSSMRKTEIPLSPGNLIPLDDPSRDINFPNLGNRSVFAASEEQSLFSIISRVTSLSDLNFGANTTQGALRTATGASALVSESNANLDIFLRRANRGFRRLLKYMYELLVHRLPRGYEFRVTGDDGKQYFRKIKDRQDLQAMIDFEIEPNSSNSNPQITMQAAAQVFQLSQNPILLQLGIITPTNAFEAAKNLLQASKIKDWSRFLTPPQQSARRFTPEELANRILAGVDVILDPTQDLQGFLQFADYFMKNDDLIGQFDEQQVIALARKAQEAQQLMQALQQAQAQAANSAQVQQNSAMTATAGAPRSVAPDTGAGVQ